MKNYSLGEFLKILATADGGTIIEFISNFQSGAYTVAGISAPEAEEYED